ncbi:ferritin-like protein [Marinitoga piezophila KA3]|uniref:Ferritin n=1 Tax=Marinitoga piezophila (strain DSM 14283 / JCM 11233 / KA3) TaxID=443254 RepID=H2J6C4_MARPK|nr:MULTISPECIES: ferritin [Marinitoga]AEX86272.1 ferritin-like protein [Marinitoga piezophila KA3]APT76679.1 ferritin [Marinitoga sp. 1137]
MISKVMEEAINKQINEEMFSAYLYLSMSAYFEKIGLKGFANWMKVQYEEEMFHAMKFYNYLLSRGGEVKLYTIKEPKKDWESPLNAFEETLEHEKHITKCINELVDLAEKEKDRATFNFLQWYIDEQVEEEANDEEIIAKLKMIKDSPNGLFMLDRELAGRTFNEPAAE